MLRFLISFVCIALMNRIPCVRLHIVMDEKPFASPVQSKLASPQIAARAEHVVPMPSTQATEAGFSSYAARDPVTTLDEPSARSVSSPATGADSNESKASSPGYRALGYQPLQSVVRRVLSTYAARLLIVTHTSYSTMVPMPRYLMTAPAQGMQSWPLPPEMRYQHRRITATKETPRMTAPSLQSEASECRASRIAR